MKKYIILLIFILNTPVFTKEVIGEGPVMQTGYQCFGGGYDFRSENTKAKYTRKNDFLPIYPKCEKPLLNNNEYKIKFKETVKKIFNFAVDNKINKECMYIFKSLEQFRKEYNYTLKKNYTDDIKRNKNYFLGTASHDSNEIGLISKVSPTTDTKGTQLRSAYLANAAVLCSTTNISSKVYSIWRLHANLFGDLDGKKKKSPIKIKNTGETAKSCSDVSVSGGDSVESFYIELGKINPDNPLLDVMFDAYGVRDQVKLSIDGKEIFDSGCMRHQVEKSFTVPKKSKKLKVEMNAPCEVPSGTGWKLFFSCDESKPKDKEKEKKCIKTRNKLLSLIYEAYRYSTKILDEYWSKSNCYVEHYQYFEKGLSKSEKLLSDCQIYPCSKGTKKEIELLDFKNISKDETLKVDLVKTIKNNTDRLRDKFVIKSKSNSSNYNRSSLNNEKYKKNKDSKNNDTDLEKYKNDKYNKTNYKNSNQNKKYLNKDNLNKSQIHGESINKNNIEVINNPDNSNPHKGLEAPPVPYCRLKISGSFKLNKTWDTKDHGKQKCIQLCNKFFNAPWLKRDIKRRINYNVKCLYYRTKVLGFSK